MTHNHQGHECKKVKMSNEEIQQQVERLSKMIADEAEKLGQYCNEKNYCGLDFYSIMFNAAAHIAADTITNIDNGGELSRLLNDFFRHLLVCLGGNVIGLEMMLALMEKKTATVN